MKQQTKGLRETTVCNFRHLLERHTLGKKLLVSVNAHLRTHGIKISNGTIVDATIIGASSSTKNREGKRNASDGEMKPMVLRNESSRGKETRVWGDQAYRGQTTIAQCVDHLRIGMSQLDMPGRKRMRFRGNFRPYKH
jgi:IS5 family transposase